MQIYVVDRNGEEHVVEGKVGEPLMHPLVAVDLVDATCGGSCSCATCHVYVDEGWLAKLSKQAEDEVDIIDCLLEAQNESRLACQVVVTEDMEGMRVTIAPKSGF
jgi:2Fe-2S ferredoxin